MELQRLFDIPLLWTDRNKGGSLLKRKEMGWASIDSNMLYHKMMQVSAGAIELGLGKGQHIAIITKNALLEWAYLDLGFQQIGIIPTTLNGHELKQQLKQKLAVIQAQCCFVEDRELYEILLEINQEVKSIQNIFVLAPSTDLPSIEDFLVHPTEQHQAKITTVKAAIHEDDTAFISFKEHSEGVPLAVCISHKAIVHCIKSLKEILPIKATHKTLSHLPMNNNVERCMFYTYLLVGTTVYFVDNFNNILGYLKEIRPHFFSTMPSYLEKIYGEILENQQQKKQFSNKFFQWAIRIGERYKENDRLGLFYFIKWKVADMFALKYFRHYFGGNINGILVGNARLRPRLGRLFVAVGIDVRECFGMDETAGIVSINRYNFKQLKFGTVGQPIEGSTIKIKTPKPLGIGEIWIKSPTLFHNYLHQTALFEDSFSDDGWFRTGELGRGLEDKYLELLGSMKDVFHDSNHNRIIPQLLEHYFNDNPFIEKAVIFGKDKPFISALIVPSFSNLKMWAEIKEIEWEEEASLVQQPAIQSFINDQIQKCNAKLRPHEAVKTFSLLEQGFSTAQQEITSDYRLNRAIIFDNYKALIESMYH